MGQSSSARFDVALGLAALTPALADLVGPVCGPPLLDDPAPESMRPGRSGR
ncbi:hypothetical protein ACH4UV_14255 [Streptomyces sp. NPDC020802]|uniref:hypothetical protein n=1 Tax=Streptomyces sp. NPDC020802 TaxID=3365094 RepID=UPI0037917CE9